MPRLPRLAEELRRYADLNHFFRSGETVAVAVSGGIDSVVLLDLLNAVSTDLGIRLAVVHVNHKLRGTESDDDERFVRKLAKKYAVPVNVAVFDTKKIVRERGSSVQTTARDLRYSFFHTVCSSGFADVAATAHTAGDNAETVLLNLVRGTGVEGLGGIPPLRADIPVVRPLLFASRPVIEAYARSRRLRFREDSSNKSDKYARNFLRRGVIPAIERRLNPSFIEAVRRSSGIVREAEDFLSRAAVDAERRCVTADGRVLTAALAGEHPYVARMVLHRLLDRFGLEPSFDRVERIWMLQSGGRGSAVDCGNGWQAVRGADDIALVRAGAAEPFFGRLAGEGEVAAGDYTISVRRVADVPRTFAEDGGTEYVDAEKLQFPLVVRPWQEGDVFVPLGMKSEKKLSDFFVDRKVPRASKKRIPVVESGNRIVWIAGLRLDDRFRITRESRSAYELRVTHRPEQNPL